MGKVFEGSMHKKKELRLKMVLPLDSDDVCDDDDIVSC